MVPLRDQDLRHNLPRAQMTRQPELPGEAELAIECAPNLRRDANRVPVLFRNENGLCEFAIVQAYQIPACSVGRIESPVDGRQPDLPLLRQIRTQQLGQILHPLEIFEPPLIDRLVDLRRAKRRIEYFGQLRPFVVEEKFHPSSSTKLSARRPAAVSCVVLLPAAG